MADEAFELAVKALSRRERSRAELEAWLRERGVEEEEVESTIVRLEELGEVDDAGFARRYAEDKRELAGWGSERIRAALLERRVAPEHIEAAVGTDDHSMEVERASALLITRSERLESERDRARALGYLTRRGYSYEVAHEAIRVHERACE